MPGDFSPEQVSSFSVWVNAQKNTYIDKLNKDFDDRAIMLIAHAPNGTKWMTAQLVENSRTSVLTAHYVAMVTSTWK